MIDIIGCLVMENLEEPGIHLLDPTSEEVWQAVEKAHEFKQKVYCHWSNIVRVRESFTKAKNKRIL